MRYFSRINVIIVLALALVLWAIDSYAAYLIERPIPNGRINQYYLWAESDDAATHKGVDWPVTTGTTVYAIESGVVVDLQENIAYGTGTGFGNFILIRHSVNHYIKQNNGVLVQQNGSVYSIYGHLSQWGVTPGIGDTVSQGQAIALTDDTGASSGPHLHLQIMLHELPDRVKNTLGTETRSRNPELWLAAYNDGATQTATAVGKVTDTSGNAVGGLRICGLQKPAGATYGTFGWLQTYPYTWANPDDILVENFGTTDVTPGTWHLYARYADGSQACNGTLYKDLGNYTFTAGQTTYIGLYPVYLPDVKANYDGWNSTVAIRNNSTSHTAQVTSTFFWSISGVYFVHHQRTDSLAPNSTLTFAVPDNGLSYYGSAMVVASQDVSVVVENLHSSGGATNSATNYAGISPVGQGVNPDWGQVGTTIYAPQIKYNRYGYTTDLYIMNVGSGNTNATISYYNNSGTPAPVGTLPCNNLAINAQCVVTLPNAGWGDMLDAKITASQPLAVVAVERNHDGSNTRVSSYNALASGASAIFAPVIKRQRYNYSTGIRIQNISTSQANITLTYYDSSTTNTHPSNPPPIPANGSITLWEDTALPTNFIGTARITSAGGQALVAQITEEGLGTAPKMGSSAAKQGSLTVYAPRVCNPCNLGGVSFTTGIRVQNVSGSTANITIQYYTNTGGFISSETINGLSAYRAQNAASIPSTASSAVITANQNIVVVVTLLNSSDTKQL